MSFLDKFAGTKIMVIGDLMLDRYWWGDVTRISPEAPVPVVRLKRDTFVPGGAANVAINAASLGANVRLLGAAGRDAESSQLKEALAARGVDPDQLTHSDDRPTNTKTRVVAHNQQVVRVDREITLPLSRDEFDDLNNKVSAGIEAVDVILVSDYAKGVLCDEVLAHIFLEAKRAGKAVVVDPKGKDFLRYEGASLLTPNRKEAAEACGLDPEAADITRLAGSQLMDKLNLTALLITESEEGMSLFEKDRSRVHYDAAAKEVYDVTGAGDTVIATMAVALAAGAPYREAAELANIAAGIVVQQLGTASITREKLKTAIAENAAASHSV